MAKTTGKKKTDEGSDVEPNFERSLTRLEQIVEELDDGNLPLEKSLALFKEGTTLARACRELLAEAEVQVKDALRDVESPSSTAVDDEDDSDDEDEDEGA